MDAKELSTLLPRRVRSAGRAMLTASRRTAAAMRRPGGGAPATGPEQRPAPPPPLSLESLVDLDFIGLSTGVRPASVEEGLARYDRSLGRGTPLQTHPLFDPRHYLAAVGDTGGLDPLRHFLERRPKVSPSPYFDARYYSRRNHDVTAAKVNPFEHYIRFGGRERRVPHPLFDPLFVKAALDEQDRTGPDLLSAYLMAQTADPQLSPHPLIDAAFVVEQAVALGLGKTGDEPLHLYLEHEDEGLAPHPLFDPEYYRYQLLGRDVPERLDGESWLAHFLRVCTRTLPLDPCAAFSTRSYWRAHSDIGPMNPLYHYARFGHAEMRAVSAAVPPFDDENVRCVFALEPTLFSPHQDPEALWGTIYPNVHRPGIKLVERALSDIGSFRPTLVYLFSGFRRGGAERLNLKLIDTVLREDPDARILVMLTDGVAAEAAHWCPSHERLRICTFEHEPNLQRHEAVLILGRLLEILRPEIVVNCNSALGWEAYQNFGRPLSSVMRLAASLFCYDYDKHGNRVGYARDYVRDTIEHLDFIFTDNRRFAEALADDFSLRRAERDKLKVLYQVLESRPEDAARRWPDLAANVIAPRLLWPMRFHRQKRPDVFRDVALAMPDIGFDAWVPDGEWNESLAKGPKPANVHMLPDEGQAFEDLDLANYLGLLSTSQWEGVPTVLLEAARAGLPIVAADVGGVGEVIGRACGYPVADCEDVETYVRQIRALIADPEEADARRRAAFDHVSRQHGRARYVRELRALGLAAAVPPEPRPVAAEPEVVDHA